jgi:hypothetical protein
LTRRAPGETLAHSLGFTLQKDISMISSLLRIVFSLLLMVGVPLLSWRSARPEELKGIPRTALYFSAVVSQWVLAVIGVLVVFVAWPEWSEVGIVSVPAEAFLKWTTVLVLISVAGLGGPANLKWCAC